MTPYDTMERLIDKYGVADVLLMVSDICNAKAEHIDVSYGDGFLAGRWAKTARIVQHAVKELPKVPGIK